MKAADAVLSALLGDDIEEQATRDAARRYAIERTLLSPSLPPVARMTLQRERASLLTVSS